jgi:hypothetical protein
MIKVDTMVNKKRTITLEENVHGTEVEVGALIRIFPKEEEDEYVGYYAGCHKSHRVYDRDEIIISPSKKSALKIYENGGNPMFTEGKSSRIALSEIAKIEWIVGMKYCEVSVKK